MLISQLTSFCHHCDFIIHSSLRSQTATKSSLSASMDGSPTKSQGLFCLRLIKFPTGPYICKNSLTHYYLLYWPYFGREIKPKHSEGIIWAQIEGNICTWHPCNPPYSLLFWPYIWILNFWIFIFGVIRLIWRTAHDLLWVLGGNKQPWFPQDNFVPEWEPREKSATFAPVFICFHDKYSLSKFASLPSHSFPHLCLACHKTSQVLNSKNDLLVAT